MCAFSAELQEPGLIDTPEDFMAWLGDYPQGTAPEQKAYITIGTCTDYYVVYGWCALSVDTALTACAKSLYFYLRDAGFPKLWWRRKPTIEPRFATNASQPRPSIDEREFGSPVPLTFDQYTASMRFVASKVLDAAEREVVRREAAA